MRLLDSDADAHAGLMLVIGSWVSGIFVMTYNVLVTRPDRPAEHIFVC